MSNVDYRTLCDTVDITGNGSEFVGQYFAIRGDFSMGRMVYSSEKGKYLKVHPSIDHWVLCDKRECPKFQMWSGGGPNSMNPSDKEAIGSKMRWPNQNSWGSFDENNTEWLNVNITGSCEETISKQSLKKDLNQNLINNSHKIKDGIFLSTKNGILAEYLGNIFGFYRKQIINGHTVYSQMDSKSSLVSYILNVNNVWILEYNGSILLRNNKSSIEIPTTGWEAWRVGGWYIDNELKVEDINDTKGKVLDQNFLNTLINPIL